MFTISDPINAIVSGLDVRIEDAGSGPLVRLTFVAKDLFDVAGPIGKTITDGMLLW